MLNAKLFKTLFLNKNMRPILLMLIFLTGFLTIGFAESTSLAPAYVKPGVNVTMLRFNVTGNETGNVLMNVTINQTGSAKGSNITAVRILNETNIINETLSPTFPITLGINVEISNTTNFTIEIELNSSATHGITIQINVTSIGAEENVSYTNLPYTSGITRLDALIPVINESMFLSNSFNGNLSGTMNITFNITDENSGINNTCVKFMQGSENITPCFSLKRHGTMYYNDTYDTNNLVDGYYNISIYTEDNAGNYAIKTIPVLVNNTIENVIVIANDTVAYIGGNDNTWSFIFNITAPISCRPIIRLDEWRANGTSYKISPNGNATWRYNTSNGIIKTYHVKTTYDNTQYIYTPKDYDASDTRSLFQFVLTMIIRETVPVAGNWFTNYYIKCQ